jgi:hypothetical protein
MTNSAGFDYGMGQSNIDKATGIRYGVISPHTPSSEAVSDIYSNGDNLSYRAAVEEAKSRIAAALTPVLDDLGVLPYVWREEDKQCHEDTVTEIVDGVWESVEQAFNDHYEEDSDNYRYEQDGYVIETTSLGLYVVKSDYYTYAPFCSPCAPGAGNLDDAFADTETRSEDHAREVMAHGVRTYCLGHDWFEDNKAPYRVFRVADDVEAVAGE